MLTGLKENSEYTAQITPYHGQVNAEIIVKDKSKGFHEPKLDLYITVAYKSFGRFYRSAPTEQNYIDAKKWIDKQLSLIEKYGTVIVTKPEYLNEIK